MILPIGAMHDVKCLRQKNQCDIGTSKEEGDVSLTIHAYVFRHAV
jgi:hypothetical protein